MAFWGADSVLGSLGVGLNALCVCVYVYLWRLSPSISFAIEFGIIFHFCLRISHTHTRTESKGHKWPEWDHARNWEAKVGGGALGGMGVVGVARGIK